MNNYENQNQPEYRDVPPTPGDGQGPWMNQGGWQNGGQGQNPENGWQNGGPGQGPYNPYDPYGNMPPKPRKQRNGFATGALICGVLGLLNLCCFAFPTAIIFGVGAISFAVISKKGQPMSKTAIVAVVLGIIVILLGVGEFVYSLKLIEIMKDPEHIAEFNQLFEQFEQFMEEQAVQDL